MLANSFIMALLMAFSTQTWAFTYYSPEEENEYSNGSLTDAALTKKLRETARGPLRSLGYSREMKNILFSEIHMPLYGSEGYVLDVYCNYLVELPKGRDGQYQLPHDKVLNVEHTMPQSRGAKSDPARSDMHHLFPSDSMANNIRGNYIFAEINNENHDKLCESSEIGDAVDPFSGSTTGYRAFLPPAEHRGNVARALFYSAIVHNYSMPEIEEAYLRKWHIEDPVDSNELSRNESVQSYQGNRNPFVDFPTLVDRITRY